MPQNTTTPRHVSNTSEGEETRLMQPVGYERPLDIKPLDLPRNPFGGYKEKAVEEHVAELVSDIESAHDRIRELKRESYEKDQEKSRLNGRIASLVDLNKNLQRVADRPYEKLGIDLQALQNAAQQQHDALIAKAKEDAKAITDKAQEDATAIRVEAAKNSEATVRQAKEHKQRIDEQADARIKDSQDKAAALLSDANRQAKTILDQARSQADRLDQDSKTRSTAATQRELEANQSIANARALLADALNRLTPGTTPRLPVVVNAQES